MLHFVRHLMHTLVVVALAAGGAVRGDDVLCIAPGGHVAVESVGECKEFHHSSRPSESLSKPPCVDISLAASSAARAEHFDNQPLPSAVTLLDVVNVTPLFIERVRRPSFEPPPRALSGPPTRTIVLLI